MNLQELLLASKVDVRPRTHELGEWLHRLTLDDLQQPATWRRLRVLVVSDLLTGKVPQSLEALEIVPAGPPVDTQTWYLFGDARHPIDLSTQDWGVAIINARACRRGHRWTPRRTDTPQLTAPA